MPIQRGSFRVVALMTGKWERLPVPAEGVVSRQLGEEFVVLSTARNEAHSLTGPSAVVWRSVRDGTRPALPDEEVDTAVEALLGLGLLARPGGLSRRRMLQGGVVVTAVGISSIALPSVAAAASGSQSYGTRDSGATTPIFQFPGATIILPINARNIVVTLVGAPGGAGGNGNRGAIFSPFGDGTEVTWTLGVTLPSALTLTYTVGGPGGTGGIGTPGPGGTGFEVGANGGTGGQSADTSTSGGGGGGGGSTGVTASGTFSGSVIAGGGGGGGGAGASLTGSGEGGAGGSGDAAGGPNGQNGAAASDTDGGAAGPGGGQAGKPTGPATAGASSATIFGPGGGGGGGFVGGGGGGAATGVTNGRAAGGGGGGAGGSTPSGSLPEGSATYGVAPIPDSFFKVTYIGGPAHGTGVIGG
jgi:hypothetical protein